MKPFQGLLITLSVLGLALAGPGSSRSAVAAGPHIIISDYEGAAHHRVVASQENIEIGFHFNAFQPNGNFTGTLNSIPITGVRTAGRHITFSGQSSIGGVTLKIENGQAQFSATSIYLDGTFTLAGNVQPSPNGFYAFESSLPLGPAPPAPLSFQPANGKIHTEAFPFHLGTEYDGHVHHSSKVSLDSNSMFLDFLVVHADGTFKGVLGLTPIHGKIKKNGHFTFQGKGPSGPDTLTFHGQGDRSATGLFIDGQVTVVGTGAAAASSGQYFFETNEV
jgi:hypothetical protein